MMIESKISISIEEKSDVNLFKIRGLFKNLRAFYDSTRNSKEFNSSF